MKIFILSGLHFIFEITKTDIGTALNHNQNVYKKQRIE